MTHLDSNFLSGFGARRVELGPKIADMNADAFFEAKDLENIVSHSNAFTVSNDAPALYTYQHSFLLDSPSAASDGGPYTVHEGAKVIYSMDNASFGKLDLMHVSSFSVTSSNFGAYLQSDRDSLYTNDGRSSSSPAMSWMGWGGLEPVPGNRHGCFRLHVTVLELGQQHPGQLKAGRGVPFSDAGFPYVSVVFPALGFGCPFRGKNLSFLLALPIYQTGNERCHIPCRYHICVCRNDINLPTAA